MDKQAIFDKLKAALIEDFEMDEAKVTPEARLYEDLELDSIDAVDLIVKLKCRPTSTPKSSRRSAPFRTLSTPFIT